LHSEDRDFFMITKDIREQPEPGTGGFEKEKTFG
jgi:hypothetical protein